MAKKTYDGTRKSLREDQRAILYMNIFTGIFVLLAGMWIGTQVAAAELGYQPRLGSPWFAIGDIRVYYPWRFLQWDYYYGHYMTPIIWKSYAWLYGSIFVEGFIILYLAVWRATGQKVGDSYGSARWADWFDLKKGGLLEGRGIVLGQTLDKKTLIQDDGPSHAIAAAGPRSGKGVGLVIPTLLAWEQSVITLDIKGENWVRTAAFRSTFSYIIKYDPTSRDSIHYNPLFEIRKGDNEFRDTQAIADMVLDSGDPNQRSDHWARAGKSLLIGMILHVLYAEKDKSLPGVTTFMSNPQRGELDTLEYMLTYPHLGDQPHPIIASMVREVLDKAENELSGVFSTTRGFLTLYHDPVIASNIRDSEFRIKDLMNLEHPVSLYLTVPGSDISRVKPLLRIMLNQIGHRLTESMSDQHDEPNYKHRLLLMLDEFASLGYMEFFESQLAYLPGYGIRAFLIVQSLNQIEKYYGPNNSIMDNCDTRITYGATDDRTAKRISELLGQSTQVRKMANYAGSRLAPFLGHVMVSEQESPRPLLTPGEVMSLPVTDSVIMPSGVPQPYYGRRVRFYEDPVFSARAHHKGNSAPPPQKRDDLVRELPAYDPCDWELAAHSQKVSHEKLSDPPLDSYDEYAASSAGESPALTEGLDTRTDLQDDVDLALPDMNVSPLHKNENSRDKDSARELDEDRDHAIAKQRARIQQMRRQQQLGRNTELGRSVTKDLPL